MSSRLKLYIDFPFEIWIDSNFICFAETGKPNIITLRRGVYQLEFKEKGRSISSKIIKIEEDDYDYLENIQLIQGDSRFELHENIYYSLGTYSFAQGAEMGLWSEDGYAITKPIYYKIQHLGYGMRDIHNEAFGVDDLYEVRNFSDKIGIISPTGIELLKCEYSEILRIYNSIPNTRLFIEMLFYVKYKRIGELLSMYEKWFPNSLKSLNDVSSVINILPVFWFSVAKKYNKIGVVGLNNEIFVPFEFEDCEFIGSNDIFCNIYEQIPTCEYDEQITRQNAYPLHFKVKLNSKWGIYQWNPNGNSRMITDIKYDNCDYAPNGLMVEINDKAALVDENGVFITEFVDKSNWWVFAY